MSGPKTLPAIDIKNLRPPYPFYLGQFFTDENQTPLDVKDERHGFRHASTEFALINAWWMAEAAGLVYDNPKEVGEAFRRAGLTGFEPFDTLDRRDTQCFVAHNEEFALVVFRGTESNQRRGETGLEHVIYDVMLDADFPPTPFGPSGGKVHGGFKKGIDRVWDKLAAHLLKLNDGRRTFWFTGHSLGAALATLAVARSGELQNFRAHGLYTFGSPLVGDADFRAYFDGLLRRYGITYYRFVNNRDLVTTVPPEYLGSGIPPVPFGYGHVGALKFIGGDGVITDSPGKLFLISNFFNNVVRRATDLFGTTKPITEKIVPTRLNDHVPMFYATHIWNAHVKE